MANFGTVIIYELVPYFFALNSTVSGFEIFPGSFGVFNIHFNNTNHVIWVN